MVRVRPNHPEHGQIRLQHLAHAHAAFTRRQAHLQRAARVRVVQQADVLHRDAQRRAELDQLANAVALHGIVEQDDQFGLALELAAQQFVVAAAHDGGGVVVFADGSWRHHVNARPVVPVVGADLIGEQGMFQRQVGTEDQKGSAFVEVRDGGQLGAGATQRIE